MNLWFKCVSLSKVLLHYHQYEVDLLLSELKDKEIWGAVTFQRLRCWGENPVCPILWHTGDKSLYHTAEELPTINFFWLEKIQSHFSGTILVYRALP